MTKSYFDGQVFMDKTRRIENNKEIIEWAKVITIAGILAILIRIFIFEFDYVDQSSMYPTLKQDDKICYIKVAYLFEPPVRGDIVIIKVNNVSENYVKRVIGIGGENIEIKNNKVYINGALLKEDYLVNGLEYADYSAVRIPEGYYFVMGDNRPVSLDSRYSNVGFIARKAILGKVVLRLDPFTVFK